MLQYSSPCLGLSTANHSQTCCRPYIGYIPYSATTTGTNGLATAQALTQAAHGRGHRLETRLAMQAIAGLVGGSYLPTDGLGNKSSGILGNWGSAVGQSG